jgi:hypothetical protein
MRHGPFSQPRAGGGPRLSALMLLRIAHFLILILFDLTYFRKNHVLVKANIDKLVKSRHSGENRSP